MKKILQLILAMAAPLLLSAQEQSARPNHITGGFYLKAGPVFPVGPYAKGQTIPYSVAIQGTKTLTYLPAKIGATLDIGYLIYLGPSFANNYLRAGIDATFLNFWFNSTSPPDRSSLIEKYYTFAGQKFGPVVTVNPIDRLMLDFSYKLNANFSYHDELDGWKPLTDSQTSEYGYWLIGNEVSLGIRYSLLVFSMQYDFGYMNYNDGNKNNKDQKINTDTFRMLIGLKF